MKLKREFENKAMSFFHLLKWQRFTLNIKMGLLAGNTTHRITKWRKIDSFVEDLPKDYSQSMSVNYVI